MLQHCTSSNAQENGELEKTSMGPRQLSVSSDSRLLEDEIKQEVKVILRPKKPPRPQSEVFLDQVDKRRTKRYSAFGVSPCFLILREKAFRRLSETTSMEGEKSFWFLISFSRITSYRSYSRLFANLSAVLKFRDTHHANLSLKYDCHHQNETVRLSNDLHHWFLWHQMSYFIM